LTTFFPRRIPDCQKIIPFFFKTPEVPQTK
jgi:hypothetical protein